MYKKTILAFSISLFLLSIAFAQPSATKLKESVLLIINFVDPNSEKHSTGTGFLINNDGYMVTNHHVVENNKLLLVLDGEIPGKDSLKKAVVVWESSEKDLAIIKVENLSDRPAVELASKVPDEGEPVTAIGFGNLGGLDQYDKKKKPSITKGNLSKIFQGPSSDWNVQVLAHTAALNSGNSGGPLFDACGRAIGVNTATPNHVYSMLTNGLMLQGVNFSSNINEIIPVLQSKNIHASFIKGMCVKPDRFSYILFFSILGMLIASSAIVLSLKKPPQIIETYTQYFRRTGNNPLHPSPTFSQTISWRLSGKVHQTDDKIDIKITEEDLKRNQDITIGRNSNLCDYVISGIPQLGRRHVRIIYKNGNLMAEDLDSTNKTYVDNIKLKPGIPVVLKRGSVLNLANTVYLTVS